MRNLIKVGIALFFILGSFLLGRYSINIEQENRINQYKDKIDSLQIENTQLQNSISKLIQQIDTISWISTIENNVDSTQSNNTK
jgi:peptidoglycan hydrolase CwlO-like protein